MKLISIVIPAINEESCVDQLSLSQEKELAFQLPLWRNR
jgi:hypothetical protein